MRQITITLTEEDIDIIQELIPYIVICSKKDTKDKKWQRDGDYFVNTETGSTVKIK